MKYRILAFAAALMVNQSVHAVDAQAQEAHFSKGIDIEKTGLIPRYPDNSSCSPLTSYYASWDDVDGTKRDEAHSGVDGGRLGDAIRSPAAGVVRAVWRANWGWGEEGALLIRHSRQDLGLDGGPEYYYSEFDHLQYDEIRSISDGSQVARGEQLATVSRPGGKEKYLPEVHWEVWEIANDAITTWGLNKFKGRYWTNKTGHLIDPLYMLARNLPPSEDGSVDIIPYDGEESLGTLKGFTYILPCPPKKAVE
jgi:murein DD-endopeptidase MepM/ murein hydrolase activator NlpD